MLELDKGALKEGYSQYLIPIIKIINPTPYQALNFLNFLNLAVHIKIINPKPYQALNFLNPKP